ncbi:phage late control protein Gpd [Clostridium puniceum]|uniref:Phage late control protein Gpd n=1 Tax=Clostridium puniceum TaxID=29367 RepID=A0A1S8TEV2_9CLOT|nr:contractile injection system protein, VgrG/Pvc8 family [Clostridium puniceum]OOM76181.1 phage late control protein Gpd [Clostridium puniceum]
MDPNQVVESINYEKIRVSGYTLESIKNLKIDVKINEHIKLYLSGILKNEEDKDIDLTTDNKTIEVYYEGNENITLFYGIVTNIEINVEREVYKINIEAKSMSYLMDVKLKSKSFQDISMTTRNLIKSIMSEYSNSNYILNIPDEEVKEFLVQYEETDWQFLKRIASRYNQGLFSVMDTKSIQYVMGVPDQVKELKGDNTNYKVYKELGLYEYMLKNFLQDADEIDYITYEIETYEILKLGDNIQMQGQSFYVYEGIYEIKNGQLENTYKLRIKNGLRQKRIFNTNIIGSSIDGKIIKVQGDLVKIHLNIDECQEEEKAYWFKFSTMSASTDGSGWYCMPEIGDSVRAYFPTKDEDETFAVSAVSGYIQGAGESEDRMGNPDDKYLRTAHDKQVKLTPAGIFISCDSGQAEMNLTSDGTLSITSQNNINVNAKENIKIQAQKSFLVSSKKTINFACDKGGGLDFDQEGQIKEKGTQVNNN